MRLTQALVGTTRIPVQIYEILIAQCLVTPKRAGASGSKFNDYGISTLNQACSKQYSVIQA